MTRKKPKVWIFLAIAGVLSVAALVTACSDDDSSSAGGGTSGQSVVTVRGAAQ